MFVQNVMKQEDLMSFKKSFYYIICCDGKDCGRTYQAGVQPNLSAARLQAWGMDWNCINKKDYCPRCSIYR